jgi:hypothetical protein
MERVTGNEVEVYIDEVGVIDDNTDVEVSTIPKVGI